MLLPVFMYQMVPLPSHHLVKADTKFLCYGKSLLCGLQEVIGMAKCKGSVFMKITLAGKRKGEET